MSFIKNNFSKATDRTLKYKRNSFYILILQSINIVSSFLLVTVVLDVLGVKEYGVWVTITTIVSWFSFIDVGLGHGLRNNYAIAKSQGDFEEVKTLISTTFYTLLFISVAVLLILMPISYFINWSFVLNAALDLNNDIKLIMIFMILSFSLRTFLTTGLVLKSADQDPYVNNLVITSGNLLSLIYAYLLVKSGHGTLLNFGIGLAVFQVLPYLLSFIVLFTTTYKKFIPQFKMFSKRHLRVIYSLGIKFFVIQLLNVVLLQSNILIIAHIVGQEAVTEYNISYKYLWPIMILFTSLVIPLWSAATEAYQKGDFVWLQNSNKKLKKVVLLLSLLGLIAVLISPFVYKVWLKDKVKVDFLLMSLIYLYFVTMMWYSIFRMFMNGVGKIKLQYFITFVQSLFHIPLAIILSNYFSIYGVIICMIFWNVINCVWEPLQYKRIMNKSASGIWYK